MRKKTPPMYLHKAWSEAKFKQHMKSALRKASQRWPPINEALKRVERKIKDGEFKNGNPKFKTQHQCEGCLKWFDKKRNTKDNLVPSVVVDHIDAIGGWSEDIRNWAKDLGEMYEKTFVSVDKLMCLCDECHADKTKQERETGAWKR